MDISRSLPIERARGLTPDIFQQRYLAGSGKPVILTDAMNSWKALTLWSFDLFATRYGSDTVAPRIFLGQKCAKLMALSDYLDYLDAPEKPAQGLWIDAKTLHPRQAPTEAPEHPLYLAWNVFGRHPELLEDIELSPRFVEDWLPFLPTALRSTLDEATRYFAAGLMIGPKDAQIGLHYDILDTHAYLAQIVGRKRCTLFSPEDSAAIYNGKVDPDAPDFEKFPLFRNATAFECILEPGELLFMPHQWWHHAVCLEKSITVNYNFFNRVNFAGYLTSILRDLPTVVRGLENSPAERAALGIEWKCRGFDFPESNKT
jgi:ribosomal protein L16 Arg81 hydroxylase